MDIIVLLGPPAVGKGTQAAYLAQDGYLPFSTGQYLRDQVAAGDPAALAVQGIIDAGGLVPDNMMIDIVARFIHAEIARGNTKITLDGFPRTLAQAQALQAQCQTLNIGVTALHLYADDAVLEDHRQHRVRQALAAGKTPRAADANKGAFDNRIQIDRVESAPLLDFYAKAGLLRRVDAAHTPDETAALVRAALAPSRAPAVTPLKPPSLG